LTNLFDVAWVTLLKAAVASTCYPSGEASYNPTTATDCVGWRGYEIWDAPRNFNTSKTFVSQPGVNPDSTAPAIWCVNLWHNVPWVYFKNLNMSPIDFNTANGLVYLQQLAIQQKQTY
ncbi:MAG: hypothetical protein QNJ47_11075, partial [Nostocaceae cyanobacterium]|nr:hypothetical protein [Nostocaceae cyanobacterium]